MQTCDKISGTFTAGDLVAGILSITHEAVAQVLECVINNPTFAEPTQRFDVTIVNSEHTDVNIGEDLSPGTWTYDLIYTNL